MTLLAEKVLPLVSAAEGGPSPRSGTVRRAAGL